MIGGLDPNQSVIANTLSASCIGCTSLLSYWHHFVQQNQQLFLTISLYFRKKPVASTNVVIKWSACYFRFGTSKQVIFFFSVQNIRFWISCDENKYTWIVVNFFLPWTTTYFEYVSVPKNDTLFRMIHEKPTLFSALGKIACGFMYKLKSCWCMCSFAV